MGGVPGCRRGGVAGAPRGRRRNEPAVHAGLPARLVSPSASDPTSLSASSRARALVATVLLALGACRFGDPEPKPLRGPEPAVVAIWPHVAKEFTPARATLLVGLDGAVRARGYRVVTAPVAAELLAGAGVAVDADPASAGLALGADAVLVCAVRSFAAVGERPLQQAEWDLTWRLVSTRGLGELWSWNDRGTWLRPRADGRAPGEPLDALPEVANVGGGPVTYRGADELCAALHRSAMLHLPKTLR